MERESLLALLLLFAVLTLGVPSALLLRAASAAMLSTTCGATVCLGVLLPWRSVFHEGSNARFPDEQWGVWNGTQLDYFGSYTCLLGALAGAMAALAHARSDPGRASGATANPG